MQSILNQKRWVWPRNLISMWGVFCLMREELIHFSSLKGVTWENRITGFCLLWFQSYFHAQKRGASSPRLCLQVALEVSEPLALYTSLVDCFLWCPLYVPYVHIEFLTQDPTLLWCEVLHSIAQTKNPGGHISPSLTLPTHLICQ